MPTLIPQYFCWTRFGTEAGQPIHHILERKEQERRANGGLFFWGIGNAVGPSVRELIRKSPSPEVLFSPIKSVARLEDVHPQAVVAWTSAEDLFGEPFLLPKASLITSRYDPHASRLSHYALACFSDEPLRVSEMECCVHFGKLRNILTGRPVGASQVTSVVELVSEASHLSKTYRVAIRARLIEPFFVRLSDPMPLTAPSSCTEGLDSWCRAVEDNWTRRLSEHRQPSLLQVSRPGISARRSF